MRRWPVTVAEFGAFVAAGGYTQDHWWQDGRGEDEKEPQDWYHQQQKPNRPVVGISWFTARAFCRWATHDWKLPVEGIVDLPTSKEWEVAARRGTGRAFPWGKEESTAGDRARAAYDWGSAVFRERQGVPVGAFPLGYTPEVGEEGPLWDMAGTIWEWCATVWEEEEVDCQSMDKVCQADDTSCQKDDKAAESDSEKSVFQDTFRVLRGGSWLNVLRLLRAACRSWFRPWHRGDNFGFRVVVRVPEL